MHFKIGRVRYLSCFIIWLSLFTFYALRSNISIALLSMAKQSKGDEKHAYSSCIKNLSKGHLPEIQHHEFDWTETQQGNVLASFFVGYFSTHFLGAIASHFIGPRWVMIISLFGATVFTYLMLILPYIGVNYFIIGRIMIGVFSGPIYPIVHELVAEYSPAKEITIMNVVTHTGNIVGLCANFVVGGYIVEHYEHGWKILFFMNGILGTLCLILCLLFLFSNPKENPYMREEEKILIMGNKYTTEPIKHRSFGEIPVFSIMLNSKVFYICLAQFGNGMIMYAQLTGYPKYISNVYGKSKLQASIVSTIPFMSNFFSQILYPLIVNFGNMSHMISKTTYRRLSSGIAFVGVAIFFIPVGFVPCEYFYISIFFVSLSMVFLAANQSGFFTAMIDISPSNVGFIMSFACMFGSLSGVLQPQIVAYFTKIGDIKEGYKMAFVATATISLLAGLPFVMFGTSQEIQFEGKPRYKSIEMNESI